MQRHKAFVAELPYCVFRVGVLQSRDRVYHFIVQGELGDHLASRPILLVAEARMIAVLDAVALSEDPFANRIKIVDIRWEPGNFSCSNLLYIHCGIFNLLQNFHHFFFLIVAFEVDMHIHSFTSVHMFGRLALNRGQLYVIRGQQI